MERSESIKAIAPAFAAFQKEVENPPLNAANPFFKSNYADLPSILKSNRPLLASHGLAVHQDVTAEGIYTLLMHDSGEWILAGPLPLVVDKSSMQAEGSAITYGRRYALCAVLGIAGEGEDDDANTAEPPKAAAKPKKPGGTISEAQSKLIHVWLNKVGIAPDSIKAKYGVEHMADLTKNQMDDIRLHLEDKKLLVFRKDPDGKERGYTPAELEAEKAVPEDTPEDVPF